MTYNDPPDIVFNQGAIHLNGGVAYNESTGRLGDPVGRCGHGVYPLNDDADPYGAGCSGPAV